MSEPGWTYAADTEAPQLITISTQGWTCTSFGLTRIQRAELGSAGQGFEVMFTVQ